MQRFIHVAKRRSWAGLAPHGQWATRSSNLRAAGSDPETVASSTVERRTTRTRGLGGLIVAHLLAFPLSLPLS